MATRKAMIACCQCGKESIRWKRLLSSPCVNCAPKNLSAQFTGKKKTHAKTKRFSLDHCAAVEGLLRDPSGVVHYFRNIRKFVDDNKSLFLPEDTASNARGWCRAWRGIYSIYSGQNGTWKGWTLVSDVEIKEHGWDLLRRKYQEAHTD